MNLKPGQDIAPEDLRSCWSMPASVARIRPTSTASSRCAAASWTSSRRRRASGAPRVHGRHDRNAAHLRSGARSDRSRRSISSPSCRCETCSVTTAARRSSTTWLGPRRPHHRLRARRSGRQRRRSCSNNCSTATTNRDAEPRVSNRRPAGRARLPTGNRSSAKSVPARTGGRGARSRRRAPHRHRRASPPSSCTGASPTGSRKSGGCATRAKRFCSSRRRRPRRAHDRAAQGIRRPGRPGRARRRCAVRGRARGDRQTCRAGSACPTPACRSTPKPTSSKRTGARPSERRSATKAFLSDLRDLKVGDFVVHVDHGIGTFVGLKQIGVGDSEQEFLELRYAGEDKLFVPVERLDLVQKYTGATQAAGRSARRRVVGTRQEPGQEGHARHGRGAAQALRRAQGRARPRVRRGLALAAGVRGRLRVRPDARSEDGGHRHQARHGIADADGPAALRRRRLRQDRGRDARGLQGGDGRQAGRVPRADDRARVSAREDAEGAVRRLPGADRHGQPLPLEGGTAADARRSRRRQGRHHRRHAPAAVEGRAVPRSRAARRRRRAAVRRRAQGEDQADQEEGGRPDDDARRRFRGR